jgi:predicted site-specific integrase-resolvase
LNFKRPKFLALIDSIGCGEVGTLVLAHKDRLARFGFDLISHLCAKYSCEILLLNTEQVSPEQEMVQDLMAITHCFSSRLYGLRNYRKALKDALK